MTATDRLRALLDERGVGYRTDGPMQTWWEFGADGRAFAVSDGRAICLAVTGATPEQAVDATLGETPTPPPPTMPEQPPYDLLIDLLRDEWGIDVSWDGLRRFWYVGLNEKGMWMRDERDATLGPGTCRDVAEFRGFGTKTEFRCSECGYEYSAVGGFGCDYGDEPDFHYCPNCGRKVVG